MPNQDQLTVIASAISAMEGCSPSPQRQNARDIAPASCCFAYALFIKQDIFRPQAQRRQR